jgi:hypothetical protein
LKFGLFLKKAPAAASVQQAFVAASKPADFRVSCSQILLLSACGWLLAACCYPFPFLRLSGRRPRETAESRLISDF